MTTNESIEKTLLPDISIEVVNDCKYLFISYFRETIEQIEKLHSLQTRFPIPKGSNSEMFSPLAMPNNVFTEMYNKKQKKKL